jgi:predicted dehydrogenase
MPRWSSFFADPKRSGGALFDLHIHDTDFVYWCFGRPIAVLSTGTLVAPGSINHVTTIYRYPCSTGFQPLPPPAQQMHGLETRATESAPTAGIHVTAEGSWDHHDGFAFRMRYVAIFERATADFDLTREPQLLLCRDGKSEPVGLQNLSGYDLQLRHIVEAIEQRRTTVLATLEDAAAVTEILSAESKSVWDNIGDFRK